MKKALLFLSFAFMQSNAVFISFDDASALKLKQIPKALLKSVVGPESNILLTIPADIEHSNQLFIAQFLTPDQDDFVQISTEEEAIRLAEKTKNRLCYYIHDEQEVEKQLKKYYLNPETTSVIGRARALQKALYTPKS